MVITRSLAGGVPAPLPSARATAESAVPQRLFPYFTLTYVEPTRPLCNQRDATYFMMPQLFHHRLAADGACALDFTA